MRKIITATIAGGVLALGLQACNGSSSSVPIVLPAQTLYASNDNAAGADALFQLPLTSSSSSVGAFTGVGSAPHGMCVSPSGAVVGTAAGSTEFQVWSSPAVGASPSFTVSLPGQSPEDCAFDAAGDLYIAEEGPAQVLVYPAFAQGSSAGTPITSGIVAPFGVTTDAAGDVFVANNLNITEYGPLSGGNVLLHTFGKITNNFGIKIGPDGNLYVANGATDGKVDVFVPPFTDTSTFNHQISPPGASDISYFAFDKAANLYVAASNLSSIGSGIYVYAPPYTGTPVELDTLVLGLAIR